MPSKDLAFAHKGHALTGHLAWDERRREPQPGVLVIHEATGLGAHARQRADRLASEFGYVAYAMDLFGETPADLNAMIGWIQKLLADPDDLRQRLNGALQALARLPQVDPTRLAAIGYCFGGTAAVELARDGADLRAVVGFHAGLQGTAAATAATVKAKVLICNGAQDPFVTPEILQAFSRDMTDTGIDWQMNLYGRARHSFTNVDAASFGSDAYAYDADADRRSWADMAALFDETLA